jgi:NDP-sugar pyrophosphorylase family protein
MKAMILAAGLGTRLRPLTDDRPKALVTVAGRTLLELTLSRLRNFGVNEVILNVHHFADMIVAYLQANQNFGMRIEISREDVLLDTGGGLEKAAWFFLEGSVPDVEPFIVHNVDVLSTIDLARMIRFHNEHNALATLAVQQRDTSRPLLFNEQGQLCGRRTGPGPGPGAEPEWALPAQQVNSLAFCGIHIVSPRIFADLPEHGAFSIIPAYLRLASNSEKILAFRADEYYWRDLGRPENIAEAERDMKSGKFSAN